MQVVFSTGSTVYVFTDCYLSSFILYSCVSLVYEHFLSVFPSYLQSAIEYCIEPGT